MTQGHETEHIASLCKNMFPSAVLLFKHPHALGCVGYTICCALS